MSIKIDALIENPNLIDRLGCSSPTCPICGQTFKGTDRFEAKDVNARYKGKLVHVDCYYGSLGKHLDKNPIASGRVRRG